MIKKGGSDTVVEKSTHDTCESKHTYSYSVNKDVINTISHNKEHSLEYQMVAVGKQNFLRVSCVCASLTRFSLTSEINGFNLNPSQNQTSNTLTADVSNIFYSQYFHCV